MKKIAILLIYTFLVMQIYAQDFNHFTCDVYNDDGELLENPFTGGESAPQFSEVDFNNDGLEDLYIYDLSGNINSTYINTGNSYVFVPEYAANFPALRKWVLLRDYDGDGIKDIFSYGNYTNVSAMKIHKGYYDNNILHFEEQLFYSPQGNYLTFFDGDGNEAILEIESSIHPAIDDIDGDGDLDIISTKVGAGYFKYYLNMSVENGWGTDSLYYVNTDPCFGGALENSGNLTFLLSDTPGECAQLLQLFSNSQQSQLHGGFSMLTFDNDNDGDKELLFGDGEFGSMNLLVNGGTNTLAHFTEQDTTFPSYDFPITDAFISVGSYFDADFDGEKDLIISSKFDNINFDGPLMLYKNVGTTENPDFEYSNANWLRDEFVDYGKLSHPTFTDYNQDGLMDMVIGSQIIRENPAQTAASLILFENTGTDNTPEFTLVDLDWLGASEFDSYWLRPSFGDLDNDGDNDLLIGEIDGKLIYYENNAGADMPYVFENPIYEYMGIDSDDFSIGTTSNPQIVDVDDDGQQDILVGVRYGNIVFFKNTGTDSNPIFNPDPTANGNIQQFGDVSLGINKTPIPQLVNIDGVKTLYAGSSTGEIWQFGNITGNETGIFDLVTDNLLGMNSGEFASPVFIDIDRDGYLNVFVGNFRGGTTAWNTDIFVGDEIVSLQDIKTSELAIFPNPVTNEVQFSIPETIKSIAVYNVIGQLVKKNTKDMSGLARGVYILEVEGIEGRYVGRFLKE
jgi:hypothetical protein